MASASVPALTEAEKAFDEFIDKYDSFTTSGFTKDSSMSQRIGDLQDFHAEIQGIIADLELSKSGASASTKQAIQEQIDMYNDMYQQQSEALGLSADQLQTYQDQQRTLADLAVSNLSDQINSETMSVEEARKALFDDADISSYVTMLGEASGNDYVDGILQSLGYSAGEVASGLRDLYTEPDTSALTEASTEKAELQSLIEQYQESGSFTEDEVASILSEHPEYLDYLTQVGDQYQLNTNALNDWNDAVEAQSEAMDDLMDSSYSILEDENRALQLSRDYKGGSFGEITSATSSLDLDSTTDDIMALNSALAEGEIEVSQYAEGIGNAIEELNSLNVDFNDLDASGISADEAESLASAWERVGSSISDVVQQMTRQFQRGEISLSDYLDNFADLAKESNEVQKGLGKIRKEGDKWVAVTEDMDDAQKEANRSLADQANAVDDAARDIENLGGVYESFEDYNEQLQQWFGDGISGLVDFSAIEQAGEQYKTVMSDIAASTATYFQQNTAAANAMIDSLLQQSIITQQQAGVLSQQLQAGNTAFLQQLVANNGAAGATLVAQTLAATNSQVAQASAGIQAMVAGVAQIVSSLQFTVKGEQVGSTEISGTLLDVSGGTGILGAVGNLAGSLPYRGSIPQLAFGVDVTGADSGGVAAGADLIAGGGVMAGLFGGNGADLSDFAPSGGGLPVSPSSFSNPGGRGGGGGDAYEPEHRDELEDEIDLYEEVDTHLDSLANQLDRLADEQDRLTGAELGENMAQQIDLLKQQVDWQKQKLEIQKQEAQGYKDILAAQYGLTFSQDGFIQNYADKYKELLNTVNSLIQQFNAATTEAAQDALDEQIQAAQENLDKFSDLVDKYDDLISNQILESENQIEEFYDKMEDLRIEAFEKSVEAVDNIKDLQEQLIDFNAVFSGMDADDPFREMMVATQKLQEYWQLTTGDMNAYYDDLIARNEELMKTADEAEKESLKLQNQFYEGAKQNSLGGGLGSGYLEMEMNNLDAIMEQINQYKETGTSSIFGENSAALYETAQDIFESATEMILDYEDLLGDLKDAILDAIDELGEAIDRRLEQFENINDQLEHYSSIIEMLYGDKAYDLLNQAANATIQNSQNYINEIRQDIDVLKDLQSAMEEGSEQWNNLQEMIDEKQQELLDMTESTLEQIIEMYERSVNQILDKWISAGTGMDDLDWMSEQWELINRNADYYLDDVNAAYEIQKLQNKYLELLNEADNLAIQTQITQQMQEQLEYLREKDKLSEYDVAYANAQLEILQKRIALEDAQRNKSQLQLRRDTQGNYSYVYTANEDDVFSAQNDLLDAQNNAYNLSKDQMQQTQDDSLSALQDAKDMLNQIWTDANLTLEEKTERTQVIIESLREYLEGTSEQLSTAEQNIINDFIGMCELLLDENKGNLEDIYDEIIAGNTDAFDQIDDRWNTSISNWLYNMDEFDKATADMLENLTQNFEDYTERVEELGDIAGITFDDMTSHINDATDATNNLAQTTSDFINQLKQDSGVIKDYQSQLSAMTAKIQDAENAMKAYADQVRELQNELVAKELENSNLSDQVANLEQTIEDNRNQQQQQQTQQPSGGGGGGGGSSAPAIDENLAWGIAQAIWTYGGASGWGNNPTRSTKLTQGYGSAFARRVQQIINQHSASGALVNYDSMRYSSYQLLGYDTGGYTGEWGTNEGNLMANNGKLAWLHQKELVLNQADTSNILAAVQAVRSMTENFRNGAFEDLVSTLSNYGSDLIAKPAVDMTTGGNTEFNVECVFPNATNVEQIQQAILTLPEQVSQFTYRR